MPVAFPPLCPTSRRYNAGGFPTRRFSSVAGATTVRLYGSKSSNDRLSLRFAITDDEAASVLNAYQSAQGDVDYVTLPPIVWGGAEGVSAVVPAHVRWRFDGPPAVESVFPGRTNVSVELIGLLGA
jgi:hypothetical protein